MVYKPNQKLAFPQLKSGKCRNDLSRFIKTMSRDIESRELKIYRDSKGVLCIYAGDNNIAGDYPKPGVMRDYVLIPMFHESETTNYVDKNNRKRQKRVMKFHVSMSFFDIDRHLSKDERIDQAEKAEGSFEYEQAFTARIEFVTTLDIEHTNSAFESLTELFPMVIDSLEAVFVSDIDAEYYYFDLIESVNPKNDLDEYF